MITVLAFCGWNGDGRSDVPPGGSASESSKARNPKKDLSPRRIFFFKEFALRFGAHVKSINRKIIMNICMRF